MPVARHGMPGRRPRCPGGDTRRAAGHAGRTGYRHHMKALLVVLVVLLVAGGLYALAAGGVAGIVAGARKKAPGDERPSDGPTGGR